MTTLFGIIGSLLLISGDLLYVRGVLRKELKPHAFSWLVWGTLNIIAFAAQIAKDAGPGAWVTGINSISCLLIFIGALKWGDRRFLRFDWIALSAAAFSLLLWILTKEPLASIVLIVLVDFFGSLPTFRKGYHYPHEEKVLSYAFAAIAHVFALLALDTIVPSTWLYPAAIVLLDGSLSVLLLIRRKQLT
ncbi:MAG: hypothetical protein H6760_04870 [Candidatus Nomurabacteria bacterium]|nr:MAG: hypothetical protein H6760_04870 [Candidatus Nomurabacteria bacterium]